MMENRVSTRRDFLKTVGRGAAIGVVPFCVCGCQGSAFGRGGEDSPGVIRFGLCADVHKDIMHDADARLKTFISRMNVEKVDFIMQLGDFCRPYDYNQSFLDIFNKFEGPRYHVLGNHDMDGGFTREQTLTYWGVKDKYYSFDMGGYHFVVLDGNDKKEGAAPGYARYIGKKQSEWLKSDLPKTGLPSFVFSHQGFGPAGGIENDKEIRAILEEANAKAGFRKVRACFNGHNHFDGCTVSEGIYYVQINSMSNQWVGGKFRRARFSKEIEEKFPWVSYTAPYKDSLYAIVTLRGDGTIEIEGVQSEWIPPSPAEMKVPGGKRVSTPKISNRKLKAL